jgi:hypothetical protein
VELSAKAAEKASFKEFGIAKKRINGAIGTKTTRKGTAQNTDLVEADGKLGTAQGDKKDAEAEVI